MKIQSSMVELTDWTINSDLIKSPTKPVKQDCAPDKESVPKLNEIIQSTKKEEAVANPILTQTEWDSVSQNSPPKM
mgnify:CR=1 FL=1